MNASKKATKGSDKSNPYGLNEFTLRYDLTRGEKRTILRAIGKVVPTERIAEIFGIALRDAVDKDEFEKARYFHQQDVLHDYLTPYFKERKQREALEEKDREPLTDKQIKDTLFRSQSIYPYWDFVVDLLLSGELPEDVLHVAHDDGVLTDSSLAKIYAIQGVLNGPDSGDFPSDWTQDDIKRHMRKLMHPYYRKLVGKTNKWSTPDSRQLLSLVKGKKKPKREKGKLTQRAFMRALYYKHEGDEKAIFKDYEAGEKAGVVVRRRGNDSPYQYAKKLLADGKKRGWVEDFLGTNNTKLAERITKVIKESGVKQKDIANACGVSIQNVTNWKNKGQIKNEKLLVLARTLGTSVDWLLGDQDRKMFTDGPFTEEELAMMEGPDTDIPGPPLKEQIEQIHIEQLKELNQKIEQDGVFLKERLFGEREKFSNQTIDVNDQPSEANRIITTEQAEALERDDTDVHIGSHLEVDRNIKTLDGQVLREVIRAVPVLEAEQIANWRKSTRDNWENTPGAFRSVAITQINPENVHGQESFAWHIPNNWYEAGGIKEGDHVFFADNVLPDLGDFVAFRHPGDERKRARLITGFFHPVGGRPDPSQPKTYWAQFDGVELRANPEALRSDDYVLDDPKTWDCIGVAVEIQRPMLTKRANQAKVVAETIKMPSSADEYDAYLLKTVSNEQIQQLPEPIKEKAEKVLEKFDKADSFDPAMIKNASDVMEEILEDWEKEQDDPEGLESFFQRGPALRARIEREERMAVDTTDEYDPDDYELMQDQSNPELSDEYQ